MPKITDTQTNKKHAWHQQTNQTEQKKKHFTLMTQTFTQFQWQIYVPTILLWLFFMQKKLLYANE